MKSSKANPPMKMPQHYPLMLKRANNEHITFENDPTFGLAIFALLSMVFITFLVLVIMPMAVSTEKTVLSTMFTLFIIVTVMGCFKSFFTHEKLVIYKNDRQLRYYFKTFTKQKEWRRSFDEFSKLIATAEILDKEGKPYTGSGSNYWIFALCDLSGDTIIITRRSFNKLNLKDTEKAKHFVELVSSYIDIPVEAPW